MKRSTKKLIRTIAMIIATIAFILVTAEAETITFGFILSKVICLAIVYLVVRIYG